MGEQNPPSFFGKFFKPKSGDPQEKTLPPPLKKVASRMRTDAMFVEMTESEKEFFRDEQKNGYSLTIEKGRPNGKKIVLIGTKISVGRSPLNDVTIDDDMISEKHVMLYVTPGQVPFLEDAGSTNGTRVNDEYVKKVDLQESDCIQIGKTTLRFKKDVS